MQIVQVRGAQRLEFVLKWFEQFKNWNRLFGSGHRSWTAQWWSSSQRVALLLCLGSRIFRSWTFSRCFSLFLVVSEDWLVEKEALFFIWVNYRNIFLVSFGKEKIDYISIFVVFGILANSFRVRVVSCSWAEAGRVKVAGKALPNEKGKLQVGTPQQHPQGDICEAVSYWMPLLGGIFTLRWHRNFW